MGRGNRQQVFIDPRAAFQGAVVAKTKETEEAPPEPQVANAENLTDESILSAFDTGSVAGVNYRQQADGLLVAKSALHSASSKTNKEYQGIIAVGKGLSTGNYPNQSVFKVSFSYGPGGNMKAQPANKKHEFKDLSQAVAAVNRQLNAKRNPPASKDIYSPKPVGGVTPSGVLTTDEALDQAKQNLRIS